jgi:site-specific DNA-methyltransferase (adenine-specific)
MNNFKLIHYNSFELLKNIGDDTVDHTITDPPYSNKTHDGARTHKDSDNPSENNLINNSFDSITNDQFVYLCKELLRVTKRWVVMTCDFRHAPLVYDWSEFIRQGVWVKPNCTPQFTGDRPAQGHEVVLILHNQGKKRWNSGGKRAVWTHNVVSKSIVPSQKPISLIDEFIKDFTDEGETIFDPFTGYGTVGISALRNKRNFIGVENKEEHYDIAFDNLCEIKNSGDLSEHFVD